MKTKSTYRCMACQKIKKEDHDSKEIHPGKLFPVEHERWHGVSAVLVCNKCADRLAKNQWVNV